VPVINFTEDAVQQMVQQDPASPEYLANEHFRTDALIESVLQPTVPVGI
jgi:hypothetical protein